MTLVDVLMWRYPEGDHAAGYSVARGEAGGEHLAEWDEAAMGAPMPTAADLAAWALPASQARKLTEFARRYVGENTRVFPEADGDDAIANWLFDTAVLSGQTTTAPVQACKANRDRYFRGRAWAAAAASVAEAEGMSWETIPATVAAKR